ncbi:uncharacterized protein RSE6_01584 [Rhynchosporium secalis]|uniref:Uncharacterized protein n=1 Tax=Rhynchosporium secalis TaxID=38038 RepID=A0A1E1LZT7_RHYSE|nr:uncharacterized protein RSE6_01584 [Rhynchosporium secalis]
MLRPAAMPHHASYYGYSSRQQANPPGNIQYNFVATSPKAAAAFLHNMMRPADDPANPMHPDHNGLPKFKNRRK